jgi:hypothetical protein
VRQIKHAFTEKQTRVGRCTHKCPYTFCTQKYKKFWKELICLLSLHYLKMSFALKPAFAPT